MKNPKIDIVIPTKNRYEFLALVLQSLTNQTYKEWELLIVDDSDKPFDINNLPFISPFLRWMEHNKHEWRVMFGKKAGPHKAHQLSLEQSKNNYILRIDDDCIINESYIEELVKSILSKEHCGAVGGVILDPSQPIVSQIMPKDADFTKEYSGNIWEDEQGNPYHSPSLQWFYHSDEVLKPVQHIHSSFLYKKAAALAIGGWEDMNLSKVGMTEETWFTYKLHLAGWKMYIAPKALAWHLKAPVGGVRTDKDTDDLSKLYYNDRVIFAEWYKGLKNVTPKA